MVVPEKFFDVEFNKAMAFGYRTEDVDEFVTKAIELIKALQEERTRLTAFANFHSVNSSHHGKFQT